MGFIYKITNTINNKCYIGETIKDNPNSRWLSHKSSIKRKCGCPLLMKAFEKYGEDAFKFEVLIICFDEDVFKFEKEYIKKYNSLSPNGYNVAEGGKFNAHFKGKKHSEETKNIMSIKSKEYNNREEVKERARRVAIEFNKTHNIGELQKKSEKWQKALAEGRIGCGIQNKNCNIHRDKISKGLKRYYAENNNYKDNFKNHSEILTKVNGRKVSQYSLDNILIATFDSIIIASKSTDIGRRSIQSAAIGRSKTAGGYIWKYADDKQKGLKVLSLIIN
jgi:group I intron endonuclease